MSELKKYKVKLEFIYSDVVHVEAKNKDNAISEALEHCEEQYDRFYDAIVKEELAQDETKGGE